MPPATRAPFNVATAAAKGDEAAVALLARASATINFA